MKDIKITQKDIKTMAIPVGSLVLAVILFIFGGKFFWGKINDLKKQLRSVENEEQLLSTKLQTLENFQLQGPSWSQATSIAIPDSTPVVSAISQIKTVAGTFGLFAYSIETGTTSKEGDLSFADINFDIDGDINGVLSFVDGLKNTSPFGQIENLEFNQVATGVTAKVTYRAFYSDLPLSIPSVLDPLVEFSPEETNIINRFLALSPPIIQEVAPTLPMANPNPFGI